MTAPRVAVLGAASGPSRNAVWRACRDAGMDVVMVVAARPKLHDPGDPGLPVRIMTRLALPGGRGNLWKVYARLGRTLATIRPDVVHVHGEPWGLLALQGMAAGRRAGAMVALHGADNRFDHGGAVERRIRLGILRRVLPRIDGYASWNSAGVRLARLHGLRPEAPSAVAPVMLPDPERFRPSSAAERSAARARFGLPPDEVIVGLLGRLVPEKGVADGLAALRSLGERAPFLVVWGQGPLEDDLRAALAGGIRGHFGGRLDYRDVAEALRACDLVLVPSRTRAHGEEQFGRVAVEALASGCAVIAYRSGALEEVLEEGAILVPEGDTEGLAEAIGRLTHDETERRDLAEKGRAWFDRRWHPQAVAADLVGLWDRMLGR